ncbi:MAG: zinc finger domain-containing protein [Armatimonadota bacterium]|nr:zinc finger domain-containing protein [Armatimonadota bacterium]MDR7402517.1 zinc finger domain-containing protein [Armatimonadota bacterium]MDR7403705.1 zinc finger domain-containing protein [Armatimonadota bacterium]MDR7436094.1 zinc finger domain-containing protein [Armatimonadota bacterium]MDR7471973.1 zinc finger domain-containing protein [Armatimonadota bacterium]
MRGVLEAAVAAWRERAGGRLPAGEPADLLRVHRRGGQPCPRCDTPIRVVYYAERETYYCPACQTAGRVYADRRLSRLLR